MMTKTTLHHHAHCHVLQGMNEIREGCRRTTRRKLWELPITHRPPRLHKITVALK
jgi:hypothetical protein